MSIGTRIGWIFMAQFIVLACQGGCGGDADDEADGSANAGASANVDPTRATARGLFEHIQSLCNQEHPDAEAYYALVHTETARQEAWMAHVRNTMLPQTRFAKACGEKLGAWPVAGQAMVWEIATFTWKDEDADRAEIECINDHDVVSPLHMVRLGDQWWISGFTFEYAKHIGFTDPRFDEMTRMLPGIGPYIDRVTARVLAGEFSTLEQAEAAQSDAISEYSRDHPRPKP